MECPKCHIEANIVARHTEEKPGGVYTRQEYACRNPKCGKYKQIIGEQTVKEN